MRLEINWLSKYLHPPFPVIWGGKKAKQEGTMGFLNALIQKSVIKNNKRFAPTPML